MESQNKILRKLQRYLIKHAMAKRNLTGAPGTKEVSEAISSLARTTFVIIKAAEIFSHFCTRLGMPK